MTYVVFWFGIKTTCDNHCTRLFIPHRMQEHTHKNHLSYSKPHILVVSIRMTPIHNSIKRKYTSNKTCQCFVFSLQWNSASRKCPYWISLTERATKIKLLITSSSSSSCCHGNQKDTYWEEATAWACWPWTYRWQQECRDSGSISPWTWRSRCSSWQRRLMGKCQHMDSGGGVYVYNM